MICEFMTFYFVEKKRYACEKCDKVFKYKADLKV